MKTKRTERKNKKNKNNKMVDLSAHRKVWMNKNIDGHRTRWNTLKIHLKLNVLNLHVFPPLPRLVDMLWLLLFIVVTTVFLLSFSFFFYFFRPYLRLFLSLVLSLSLLIYLSFHSEIVYILKNVRLKLNAKWFKHGMNLIYRKICKKEFYSIFWFASKFYDRIHFRKWFISTFRYAFRVCPFNFVGWRFANKF